MARETTLPRTWTLLGVMPSKNIYGDHTVVDGGGAPRVPEGDSVQVIEQPPLLDLLAFFVGLHGERYTMSEDAERDAEAILRAHGRLGP